VFYINNKIILAVVCTFVFAGLIGFYSGRFYERQSFRKRFQQRGGANGFNRTGGGNRQPGGTRQSSETPRMPDNSN